MSAIRFLGFAGRTGPVSKIYGSPIIEPIMPARMRKTRGRKISSIRNCLVEGESDQVVKFVEKEPRYVPYVVSAIIDPNEKVSFNAEWCLRRLASSPSASLKVILKYSLKDFLGSPWVLEGEKSGNQKAIELASEMRELCDFINK